MTGKSNTPTARRLDGDLAVVPYDADARVQCMVALSGSFYWEQDTRHRFTTFLRRGKDGSVSEGTRLIGKEPWEVFSDAPYDAGFCTHKATLAAREPFDGYLLRRCDSDGTVSYVSVSGRPVFDEQGKFRGYRGIASDVTGQIRDAELLRLERAVTKMLAESDGTLDSLESALRLICESEGWESGQYWGLDAERNVMRFNVGWSVNRQVVEQLHHDAQTLEFAPGVGLIGKVWRDQEPLWVADLSDRDERLLRTDLVERTGWRSALLIPVHCKSELIGVLSFNAPYIPEPGPRLMQILDLLSMQLGGFYERLVALDRLRESEERFSSTVEMAAIGISHVAADGRFIHVNRLLCDMLGYTKEELLSLTIKDVSHPEDVDVTDRDRARMLDGKIDSVKVEKRYIRKDGQSIWVRITAATKRDAAGEPLFDISVVEDISDRKHAEQRVKYLAAHDEMTGLPNRATFSELLHHGVETSRRHDRRFAVLFIDLDRFKIVNDSLGHEAGDELLKEMSRRLSSCLRSSDVVARLGGDEFVVLLDDLEEPEKVAEVVSRKILSAIIRPVEISGQECRVTASIGIACYPKDGREAAALMRMADSAMYQAKEEGKNNFQFYTADRSPMSVERLTLETYLRQALDRGEFSIHYQPKIDSRSNEIIGAEALLRWWNHELGTVSPAQFIPLAEDTGLIIPIGYWVLQKACEQNVAWRRKGLPNLIMAVNLSPRQFNDVHLLEKIEEILGETGMAPELLEFEITESMIMTNIDKAVAKLAAIKRLGVRLAIDDFGTGYSSLSQLKRFPIDTLKVDRSFIRDIPDNGDDKAITEAIISMGKTLGVTVVAEGVENPAQREFLNQCACDELQGFLFSKPCHPDAFADLFEAGENASAG